MSDVKLWGTGNPWFVSLGNLTFCWSANSIVTYNECSMVFEFRKPSGITDARSHSWLNGCSMFGDQLWGARNPWYVILGNPQVLLKREFILNTQCLVIFEVTWARIILHVNFLLQLLLQLFLNFLILLFLLWCYILVRLREIWGLGLLSRSLLWMNNVLMKEGQDPRSEVVCWTISILKRKPIHDLMDAQCRNLLWELWFRQKDTLSGVSHSRRFYVLL